MIIILGLIILVAAVVVGVAGVLGNGGTHGLAHGFSVLGYHVTGSGTVFLYGIAVGAVALFGLLAAAGWRAAHLPPRPRGAARAPAVPARDRPVPPQETAAVSKDRDELIGQRDTARAYTASTLGNGASPGNGESSAGLNSSQDGGRRDRPRLFGRWPAPRSPPPRPQSRGMASQPPTSRPQRPGPTSRPVLPRPQNDATTGRPHEYRQEVRAQGRSGQRQPQEDRRLAHAAAAGAPGAAVTGSRAT